MEKTHNSPDKSMGGCMHSTTRSPEVDDFPRCNSTDIDGYERMLPDQPLVHPRDEMQHELCEEVGAPWEQTEPVRDSWHPQ